MLVDFEKLSDEEREQFSEDFMGADDLGVNDWDSSTPWGCPWFWSRPEELDGETPAEWGESWFLKNRAEIESLLAEEQESESEEA